MRLKLLYVLLFLFIFSGVFAKAIAPLYKSVQLYGFYKLCFKYKGCFSAGGT